jgi:hypothetical protein
MSPMSNLSCQRLWPEGPLGTTSPPSRFELANRRPDDHHNERKEIDVRALSMELPVNHEVSHLTDYQAAEHESVAQGQLVPL